MSQADAGHFPIRIEVGWAEHGIAAELKWQHHWLDGEEILLSLARDGEDFWLQVPDTADFLIQFKPECRVLVSPEARELDPDTLEHQLVDQILPRVLAHLGELLVHASAVAINRKHALFLGPSGFGKSTLAGVLHNHGHSVLSDDCVQLLAEGASIRALATYPSLRLNADSLMTLFPDAPTQPVADYSEKRRVPMAMPDIAQQAVEVDAVYLLGDPTEDEAGGEIRITPLRPAETCLALIRHSFRLDLRDRAASAAQLERCSQIARAIPAFRLDYPRDYALNDALAHAIVQHLASLPAR